MPQKSEIIAKDSIMPKCQQNNRKERTWYQKDTAKYRKEKQDATIIEKSQKRITWCQNDSKIIEKKTKILQL